MRRFRPVSARTSPILLAALLVSTLPAAASDSPTVRMAPHANAPVDSWPGWRGPGRQGVASGSGYALEWSGVEGEQHNIAWKVPVPGSGNSSPVIWSDRLFLTTSYDNGRRRSVLAFSIENGERLWEAFAPRDVKPEGVYPKNGHASSTVATNGELVFAYLGNHGLLALEAASGEVAWQVDFGEIEAFHGTASSPVLWRDRLFLVQDQRGGSGAFIAAFDQKTGRQLWRTQRRAQVGWNTPVVVTVGSGDEQRDEVIMSGQQEVVAYDPETGQEIWLARGSTFEVIPTPVIGHDLIFAASGRAGPTLAIRPGGSGDVTDSHVVWSTPKGSPFVVAPALLGAHLYQVNDMASVLTVYEAKTGEVAWQTRLGDSKRESFSAAPVVADGHVLFTNDDGLTFVVRPPAGDSGDFQIVRSNDFGEAVIASPAGVGGTLYYRTRQSLVAIRAEK